MQIRHGTAILLDVIDLGERDRIVSFLSADYGKKRGVAQGARTKFSRYAGQLQPLAKVDIGWREKEGRELVRIGDVEMVRPAAALQEDLEGILLGAYLAEHMSEFAQEDDPSNALFRLFDTTLDAMLGGVDRDLAARYLEVWVLRLSGVLPVPRTCPHCDRPLEVEPDTAGAVLLEAEGAVVCGACAEGHQHRRLGAGELEFLRRSGHQNLPTMSQDVPPPAVLRAVERLAASVRRHFLQAELKSYRVMRDTLGGA